MDLEELTSMYNFTGRTIIVTGGSGILGGEMACALVGCGANVAILDREVKLADRLLPRLNRGQGRATVVAVDVLSRSSLVQAEATIRAELGSAVDALINAAGGNNPKATTSADL